MNKVFAAIAVLVASTSVIADTTDLDRLLAPGVPIRIWNSHYMGQAIYNGTNYTGSTNWIYVSTTNSGMFDVKLNDLDPAGLSLLVRTTNALTTANCYDLGIYYTRDQIVRSMQLKNSALMNRIVVSNVGYFIPPALFASATALSTSTTGSASDIVLGLYGNTIACTSRVLTAGQFFTYTWSGDTKELSVFNNSTNATAGATNAYVYLYDGAAYQRVNKSLANGEFFTESKLAVNSIGVSGACANTDVQIIIMKR